MLRGRLYTPERLRELLIRYFARHDTSCCGGCTCGLDDLLREDAPVIITPPAKQPSSMDDVLGALKDAVQVARAYYMTFHSETWRERLEKLEIAVTKMEKEMSP